MKDSGDDPPHRVNLILTELQGLEGANSLFIVTLFRQHFNAALVCVKVLGRIA